MTFYTSYCIQTLIDTSLIILLWFVILVVVCQVYSLNRNDCKSMRLLTAVSSVRVCQGQPNKKNHQSMVLFVCIAIPRQTKNVVRPSYDGKSLMSKDSVTQCRSVCKGVAPTALETDEQLVKQVASSTLLRFTTQGYISLRPSLSGAAIKRKHQPFGWCFSFAVGHLVEMKNLNNIIYCIL